MVGGGFLRQPDEVAPVQVVTAHGTPDTQADLEAGLWLALRQCATHAAGPMAVAARLVDAVNAGTVDPDALGRTLRARLSVTAMPPDRRQRAEGFLEALFGPTLKPTP